MKRRFFKSVLVWVVPLLIARALIPAGFMLSAGAEGLELMFCSGSLPAAPRQHLQQSEHAGHAGHMEASAHVAHDDARPHDRHQSHRDAVGSEDNAPCPFAIAAGVASIDVPYLGSAATTPTDEFVEFASLPAGNAAAVGENPIRGPPRLS